MNPEPGPQMICPHCGKPIALPATWSPGDPLRKLAWWALAYIYFRVACWVLVVLVLIGLLVGYVILQQSPEARKQLQDFLNEHGQGQILKPQ